MCQAPEAVEARAAALARFGKEGPGILEAMSRKGERNPLAVQGIFQHPAEEAQLPAEGGGIEAIAMTRDAYGQEAELEIPLQYAWLRRTLNEFTEFISVRSV